MHSFIKQKEPLARTRHDPRCWQILSSSTSFLVLAGFLTLNTPVHAQTPEGTVAGPAAAQSGTPGAPAGVTPAEPKKVGFFDTVTTTFGADAGIYMNGANPKDGQNFGQFFEDHANELQFNQLLMTMTRPLGSDTKSYDFGFTIQGIYGSDARYLHTLGFGDHVITSREQLVPTQANIFAHLPWFTTGGVDMKFGLVLDVQGYEALDPAQRAFYSLSYLSYYFLPSTHVGGQFTIHINPTLDILTGIDTGQQTSFGVNDNNNKPAGYLGFALNNLLNGSLTITASTRFGPEDPVRVLPNANSLNRSWTDLVATYKYNDSLSFAGEGYYFYDPGFPARKDAYAVAGYAAYVINSEVTFNLRAEVLRDDSGVIVGNFLGNTGNIDSIRGLSYSFAGEPAPTTFGSLSANIVYKPSIDFKALHIPIKTLALRPEIRYDRSLNETTTFNAQTSKDAFMFGGDVIIGF